MSLSFALTQTLWALLLVPALVIAFAMDGQRRRRVLERAGHLPQLRKMTASVSVGRRRLKAVLLVVAVALLVVAVARPQRPGIAYMLPRRGLDLVVALDFSRSMLAADVYPTRLDRARAELGRFLDGLKGDRVGLVAFAGVTLAYPLTSDYAAAKLFWRDLGPDNIPVGGTNLGEAIRAGLELLEHGHRQGARDRRPPAQVMVLLTDGSDTEGGALEAAREAARQGVKIFPIGIGTREGEVVVLKKHDDGSAEYVTDANGTPVRMTLDEATLVEIKKLTGGEYFRFDVERSGLDELAKAIAGLEREEEAGRIVNEPAEAYAWFLAPALLLLVAEALLRERRRPKPGEPQTNEAAPIEARPRLGGRRRAGVSTVTVMLFSLLPLLGGWSPFERLSPDVREGNEKLAAGKAAEALSAFERALAARPDDPVVHYDRGAALYALGRLPEAQREFQRASEAGDAMLKADALYNMGNAILQQGQPKEAVEAYKRVLKLRPDDRRAKWNLELALRQLEQQQRKQQQQGDDRKQQEKNEQGDPRRAGENQQQASKDQQQADKAERQADDEDPHTDENRQQQAHNDERQRKADRDKEQAEKDQRQLQADKEPRRRQEPQQARPAQTQSDGKAAPGEAPPAGPLRDIDRQDAEAVLEAFERVEPTVQKDLARRRAGNQHPRKDY